jgi:hypothetical protein
VRRIRVSGGIDAIAGLHRQLQPELVSLDFALQAHLATSKSALHGEKLPLLPRENLPKLVELDLTRNEPGFLDPDTLGGADDIFQFLAELPLCEQLEVVRLPSIGKRTQAASLNSALKKMPKLRELAIVKSDYASTIEHATATISLLDKRA